MPLFRSLVAGSALLLAACALQAAPGTKPAAMPATMVTMLRTTCFGACPSYRVTLTTDGHITFDGLAHVQTMSPVGAQATPKQIAAVRAALQEADLRALRDSYTTREDGCRPLRMDMNGVRITISDTEGSKTVDFYYGCHGAIADQVRPRIDKLAHTIDEQLGTARWIGKPTGLGDRNKLQR
ncbi:MAG: DUF6438 domain-containing protein [Rhodanobacter sp.]|nr:DUF6438 domain-containing protein [Rhodanobacter sp.]